MTAELLQDVILNAKQMIMDDISSSIVPATIKKFNDLHHYVDANEYLIPDEPIDWDTQVEIADKAAHELDEWIAGGFN